MNEMFEPKKLRQDTICEHCGSIIPASSYCEIYQKKPYHLECIWDKLINKLDKNEYEYAREYFFSLKEKLGNWPPYGFDTEDSYLTDLKLVEHNDRINHEAI